MPQVDNLVIQKLIGPTPDLAPQRHWLPPEGSGDREPIPKWNGQNPRKTLRPWLRELRLWRQETSVPPSKHGLKLFRSFEAGSWLRQAADRVPEEQLVTVEAWNLILTEILAMLKPYLDVELDVLIEEAVFLTSKESRETMSAFVTRKMNKRRDLPNALGTLKVHCPNCSQTITTNKDLPDEIWSYLIKRSAHLTEEQRKLIHSWDSSHLSANRLQVGPHRFVGCSEHSISSAQSLPRPGGLL